MTLGDDAWVEALAAALSSACTSSGDVAAPLREPDTSLADLGLDTSRPLAAVLDELSRALAASQTKTAHPRYFGLPNPSPTGASVAGAALAAALSAQLATRLHAPLAAAIEARLVREMGARFGLEGGGAVTSGGAESNLMAMLAALARHCPAYVDGGARALPRDPVVYVSNEGHPTVAKAARIAGLGDAAVHRVRVDSQQKMRLDSLREAIANDRQAGRAVVMIVATVGTTSTGAIDDLDALADVAAREGVWLHVDAAWGGMLAFSSAVRARVAAVSRADSVTFDPHKALFVPTGMGVFLRRDASTDHGLYEVETGYLPRGREGEPHASTPAWSRPFGGLALFAALATHGFPAFSAAIDRQLALGERLRARLVDAGFVVKNGGPLPVACFVDGATNGGDSAKHLTSLARAVLRSCGAWVSIARLPGGDRVLRAAVVSHHTGESDVDALVDALVLARREG